MRLDIKTIIGFVVIAVVAYLCRPMNDKIADVFIEDKNEEEISGNIEGHDYVDLGLSVKWATCNIGASKPEGYGDYFAWGETEPKDRYESETYLWTLDDAANAQWGGSWRLPTKTEWDEILHKCFWRWTTLKGVKGYKVIARNGNWIFLPAAGVRYGTDSDVGSLGYYWSSTVDENYSNLAYYLYFKSGSKHMGSNYCDYGSSVRPVAE